jgi:cytochrome c-type biogenesis protein CcmH/NrfF
MCPVCGTSLALAREAPLVQRERALIERLAAQCRTTEQIKAKLVAEFGPTVLALPPRRGFDAAAYVVPAAGGVIAVVARRCCCAAGVAATQPRPPPGGGRLDRRAAAPRGRARPAALSPLRVTARTSRA